MTGRMLSREEAMAVSRAGTWAATALAMLILAAGCAWNEPVVFDQDLRVKEMVAKARPLPYKLAVAPLKMSVDPEASQENRYSPRVRPEALTTRFVEKLKTLNVFREVVQVGAKSQGAPAEELLTEAWDQNADLLLELDLSRYEVYWVGTNGLYIPNIVWWSFAWEAASYVDDETYGGGCDLTATLTSVHSNKKIDSWTVRRDVQLDLNDFERGWIFLGFLRVPGALDESNWAKVEEVVAPRAEIETAVELGKVLGEDFRKETGTGGFAEKMSKRLALVVGIDRWDDYRLNWVRFAGDDARAVEAALTAPDGGMAVPAKNIRTLVNERATLPGIREAVEQFLAARATAEDLVVIYYAGYGCASEDGKECYLLSYDSKVDDLGKTALSLTELKKMLGGIKARNVLVVLDAAFNADEASRCATRTVFPGRTVSVDESCLTGLGGDGRVIVLAAGPNEGAQTFVPKKHGMFTQFMLEGLDAASRPADKDKNGRIGLDELFAYAQARTSEETALSAIPQNPAMFGAPAGRVDLAVFAGATPAGGGAEEGAKDKNAGE